MKSSNTCSINLHDYDQRLMFYTDVLLYTYHRCLQLDERFYPGPLKVFKHLVAQLRQQMPC